MRAPPFLAALAALALAQGAAAVTLGFEDGTAQGWVINLLGAGSPPAAALPANVASGGPDGADDAWLRLTATGLGGAGSRLSAINVSQWAGDYTAAGITAIAMRVVNLGATDLSLRLLFADPGPGPPANQAVSTAAVFVPAGSGWIDVLFPVAVDALTPILGSAELALAGATELRIFHAPLDTFPGPDVAAQLGVDDVRAVPEPDVAALLALGLAALGFGVRPRIRGY
jgi:hypothetical protein